MPDTPEQKARKRIDAQLVAAGWLVQDRRHLNLHAAPGVALCETDVEGGFADSFACEPPPGMVWEGKDGLLPR